MRLVPCEPTDSSVSTPGFAPSVTPDSRSHSISLHHTRSGSIAHRVNATIIRGLTPSHSIPVSTDRPVQAKAEPSAQGSSRVRLPGAHTPSQAATRRSPLGVPGPVMMTIADGLSVARRVASDFQCVLQVCYCLAATASGRQAATYRAESAANGLIEA
jgi:hypothetical protein